MNAEDNKQSLAVTVGEFSFRVRVAPDEVERYERVAATANQALEQVQSGAGALAGPRAMAMALFQMAVELDDARAAQRQATEGRDRLGRLIGRIDQATGVPPTAPERPKDDASGAGQNFDRHRP